MQSRKRKSGRRPQGLILYRGPSQLNRKPIVAVATNLKRKSKNSKIGRSAIQVYILVDNRKTPLQNVQCQSDSSICGNCKFRSQEKGKVGACYVDVIRAPGAVWRTLRAKGYKRFDKKLHLELFRGRFVRWGAYGDPAALPIGLLRLINSVAENHVGYTHQWEKRAVQKYRPFLMASVDSPDERAKARESGWHTFRVRRPDEPLLEEEFVCPASEEAGKRLTCDTCKACSGDKDGGRNYSPVIIRHGLTWKARLFDQTSNRLALEVI